MKVIRKVIQINGVNYLTLGRDHSAHIEIDKGTPVVLEDDDGKFGKHIHVFKATKKDMKELNYENNKEEKI